MKNTTQDTKDRVTIIGRAGTQNLRSPPGETNCRDPAPGNSPQRDEQKIEQNARTACFRFQDSPHDPAKGEAG